VVLCIRRAQKTATKKKVAVCAMVRYHPRKTKQKGTPFWLS
jgi:hypothetical protein